MNPGVSEFLFLYLECANTQLQAITGQKHFPETTPRKLDGMRGRKGRENGKGQRRRNTKGGNGRVHEGKEWREAGLRGYCCPIHNVFAYASGSILQIHY
jgi:hypothetical protein